MIYKFVRFQRFQYPQLKKLSFFEGLAEEQWRKNFPSSEQPQKKLQTLYKTLLNSNQAHSGLSPNQPNTDARKQESSLVKSSVKIENAVDNTTCMDSHYADKNGHVEEKWTMKELLQTKQPSTSIEKKLKTGYTSKGEVVETLRQKIREAEKKIEDEKIIWKKNILNRLKKILITRLKELEEKAAERGDVTP